MSFDLENEDTRLSSETVSILGTVNSSSGSYVEYEVHYKGHSVWRRYSDFVSVRTILCRIYPVLIVPPIPEKQSLLSYAKKPVTAKRDTKLLRRRSVLLQLFLGQCLKHPILSADVLFQSFLSQNIPWHAILSAESASLQHPQKEALRVPPLKTVDSDPYADIRPMMPLIMSGTSEYVQSDSVSSITNETGSSSTSSPMPKSGSNPLDSAPDSKSSDGIDCSDLKQTAREIKTLKNLLRNDFEKAIQKFLSSLNKLENCLSKTGTLFHSMTSVQEIPSSHLYHIVANTFESSGLFTTNLNEELSISLYEYVVQSAQLAASAANVFKYRELKLRQRALIHDLLVQEVNITEGSGTTNVQRNNAHRPTAYPQRRSSLFGRLQHAFHDILDTDSSLLGKVPTRFTRGELERMLEAVNEDCKVIDAQLEDELTFYEGCQKEQWEKIASAVQEGLYQWATTNLTCWQRTQRELDDLTAELNHETDINADEQD
ncbi:sorting nexin Atg20 [Schizosaccharomyces japonicus yFS275]|uniref:Sorting nexin Atg20 n=1 Tax=Schizosaccharomyces japonicus (strain yFS275 / FY16936) TaxID=402676 RepID=B6K691_SCHJY|nr:sorting nexin Atg20 [Schizosaccharomyces japonicus yFS275]EEB09045.1 sorting nexin Atg20 [Schizosaccharomyces japonicus yFS275]